MNATTCERCGFTPKNPAKVYFSAMFGETMCDDWNACQRRIARRLPADVLMPSPQGVGPCDCGHEAVEHWLGEPGGCEGAGGCSCVTWRAAS